MLAVFTVQVVIAMKTKSSKMGAALWPATLAVLLSQ